MELASSLWDGSAWARRPFASCLRHTRDGVSVLAHYGHNFRVGGVRRPCFRFFPQPYRRRAYAHMRRHDVLPQRGHDSRHCGHDGPGPGKRGHRQRGGQVAVVCAYGPFHRPAVFGQGLYPVCQGRRRIIHQDHDAASVARHSRRTLCPDDAGYGKRDPDDFSIVFPRVGRAAPHPGVGHDAQ